MSKNQLFKKNPDAEFVLELIKAFNLSSFDDKREFTRKHMERDNVVESLKKYIEEIKQHYIPCKIHLFLEDLDEKKAITILRQFIRPFGYKIISREKYFEGTKMLLYRMENINNEQKTEINYNLKIIEF
jgi:cobalamin biosynthesis Mg chelatase CobN